MSQGRDIVDFEESGEVAEFGNDGESSLDVAAMTSHLRTHTTASNANNSKINEDSVDANLIDQSVTSRNIDASANGTSPKPSVKSVAIDDDDDYNNDADSFDEEILPVGEVVLDASHVESTYAKDKEDMNFSDLEQSGEKLQNRGSKGMTIVTVSIV
jgi:hypothetical protein